MVGNASPRPRGFLDNSTTSASLLTLSARFFFPSFLPFLLDAFLWRAPLPELPASSPLVPFLLFFAFFFLAEAAEASEADPEPELELVLCLFFLLLVFGSSSSFLAFFVFLAFLSPSELSSSFLVFFDFLVFLSLSELASSAAAAPRVLSKRAPTSGVVAYHWNVCRGVPRYVAHAWGLPLFSSRPSPVLEGSHPKFLLFRV